MSVVLVFVCFFFQAEDGIRDLVRSRGLGDVYKRQALARTDAAGDAEKEGFHAASSIFRVSRICCMSAPVSYTHLTLPTIYSV